MKKDVKSTTDIKKGIQESMQGKWNGDVNLLDGRLKKKRKEYEMNRAQVDKPPDQHFADNFDGDIIPS